MTNSLSGTARGNVVMAGTINGDINLVDKPDRDVGVHIVEAREQFRPVNGRYHLVVEVSRRVPDVHRLALVVDAKGTPSSAWRVQPSAVALDADHVTIEVTLQSTVLQHAGPRQLTLEARHVDGRSWLSNDITIDVPEAPDLSIDLVPPPEGIADWGTYPVEVVIRNLGNTRLQGSLTPSDDYRDKPGFLPPEAIGPAGKTSFNVLPEKEVRRRVKITVPHRKWSTTTWHVPLAVKTQRHHLAPTPPTLEQRGHAQDLWSLLQRLIAWGRVPTTCKRGVLAVSAAGILAVGGACGLAVSPQAPVPPDYSVMACDADTSAIVLKTMTSDDARDHGSYALATERAQLPAVLGPYRVQATHRLNACASVRTAVQPQFGAVLWLGPLPSAKAGEACSALKRDADCAVALTR